jgi:hypothetical protein
MLGGDFGAEVRRCVVVRRPAIRERWLREDGFEILIEEKEPTGPRNTDLERAKEY